MKVTITVTRAGVDTAAARQLDERKKEVIFEN